jgi:peptide/nickel transport system permease protein
MALALVLISVLSFALVRILPGDPVINMLGEGGDPAVIARVRADLGLDQPAPVYYFVWLGRVVRGDFGRSIQSNQPVAELLRDRLLPTVQLSIMSSVIALMIALPLGILAAVRRGSSLDRLASGFAMAGLAMPSFCLGILLILFFSLTLGWLPPSGWRNPFEEPAQSIRYMVLPALTLGLVYAAMMLRQVRASVIAALGHDYVRTARAKGLSEPPLVMRHAVRNALIPVITISGLMIGNLLGGTVITETIFAIPGIGRTGVDAIFSRDYPIVQGVMLMIALIVLVMSLLVDVIYAVVDPRVRYS